jgi:hypothetical protein
MAGVYGDVNPISVGPDVLSDMHKDGPGDRDRAGQKGDPLNAVFPGRLVCSWLSSALESLASPDRYTGQTGHSGALTAAGRTADHVIRPTFSDRKASQKSHDPDSCYIL